MENSGGITASLAGRYASALFDLAQEKGAVAAVEGDLGGLAAALAESGDLASLVRNPKISREDAAAAMAGIGKLLKLSPLTANFLGVLAENRRLASLGDMIRAFQSIAAASRGEISAQVTSAHPLTAAQLTKLAAQLKAREGRDVNIKTAVDPEILGGLIVRLGSQMIDSSIRTRLNNLAQAMKG